ncbi:hypothetical protein J7J00_25285 [Bacillus sp. ISL-4]|nr:hypothetical protein [Bacillus sp. ISL-4]
MPSIRINYSSFRYTQGTILFFQEDSIVPYSMLYDVYNAATVDKEKLIIPGAGHCEAEVVDPE